MDNRRQLWWRVLENKGFSLRTLQLPIIDVSQLFPRMLPVVNRIYDSHSSEEEKMHACSDIYVNCHPESSWEYLTSVLYEEAEMTAVDQARPFLPFRGNCDDIIL